uniref:Uncharacterized protein n=1 Tax=Chromera velia CCMP2878 TaxID=1169474 RepID=A0A0G4GJ72_9ALVE|eukprot:Cvel_22125.t1-p1 / transcript=Cvel_22125.t1 / gene=Cvel_22125 / organism=Chromera_velia_CCMP2878 / gene_product=Aqualysin-1, putative / transcript_product=Aqualysin-1, putative / location=Cvel_scaffold2144:20748-21229(-) / protein_length=106 / sequence_SO=supercontig / SO=protein_coding / is_pseudo=false
MKAGQVWASTSGVASKLNLQSSQVGSAFSRNSVFSAEMGDSELQDVLQNDAVEAVEQVMVVRAFFTPSVSQVWGIDRVDQENLPLDSSYTLPSDSGGTYDGSGVHM